MEKPKSLLYKCPNYLTKLNLNNMRLNNELCDVTIKVNGKEYRAHKLILAASLNYFKTMLSNESFQESKQNTIIMESVEAEDFEVFLSYAYTGEILLTDNNALNLLKVANYLGEDDVKKACIEFLQDNLREDDALQIYALAKVIEIHSLMEVAKSSIVSNFDFCSHTPEYLDLDYESLMDILSNGETQPKEVQQMLFGGIIRWIMHELGSRKVFLNGLLRSISIFALTDSYLMNYLGSMAYQNGSGLIEDIMYYYHVRKTEIIQKKDNKALIILGQIAEKLFFQSYNFTEKKWSKLQGICGFDGEIRSRGAILNDKLYFISKNSQGCSLQMFNPLTKQITILLSSDDILADSAVCACSKFLYLCGGNTKTGSCSNQILKYDPCTNQFLKLPPMRIAKINVAAIFYQGWLLVSGTEQCKMSCLVEKYDADTKEWTAFPSICDEYFSHNLVILEGKLYACGKLLFTNSIVVYDPREKSWQTGGQLNKSKNNYLVIAHAGKLLAIGGGEGDLESVDGYDPSIGRWLKEIEMTTGLFIEYPIGGLIGRCIW